MYHPVWLAVLVLNFVCLIVSPVAAETKAGSLLLYRPGVEAGGTPALPKPAPPRLKTFSPLKRLSQTPVLSPRTGKFDAVGAFNPAIAQAEDGRFIMLYRGQDEHGVSRIVYAASADGLHFTAEETPVLAPCFLDERNGIEDPRLSKSIIEPGAWDLTVTVYNTDAQLALYRSRNLRDWTRVGIMMPAKQGSWNINWTKSGAIVPGKINGKLWMYYMGDAKDGSDQTGCAVSQDGINWKDATDRPVLPRRPHSFDSRVVEPGPAPILTEAGILLLYNGADQKLTYKTGWALFDKNDPAKLIARSKKPIFAPEKNWEKKIVSKTVRQAPNVVFVEGLIKSGKNRYLVYYGAADCRVGVAETSLVNLP